MPKEAYRGTAEKSSVGRSVAAANSSRSANENAATESGHEFELRATPMKQVPMFLLICEQTEIIRIIVLTQIVLHSYTYQITLFLTYLFTIVL